MKRQGTSTDKLADVIQVLQIAHKTGHLMVNRDGIDHSLEQGTITFLGGQIVDASAGMLRGADAFKKLMTWTTCYFVFQPSQTTNSHSFPALPPPDTSNNFNVSPGQGSRRDSSNGYMPAPPVPYRIRQVNEVFSLFHTFGLSRTHRQLFLLIDGKRSTQELARLIGQQPEDVVVMLSDLERVGLIRR